MKPRQMNFHGHIVAFTDEEIEEFDAIIRLALTQRHPAEQLVIKLKFASGEGSRYITNLTFQESSIPCRSTKFVEYVCQLSGTSFANQNENGIEITFKDKLDEERLENLILRSVTDEFQPLRQDDNSTSFHIANAFLYYDKGDLIIPAISNEDIPALQRILDRVSPRAVAKENTLPISINNLAEKNVEKIATKLSTISVNCTLSFTSRDERFTPRMSNPAYFGVVCPETSVPILLKQIKDMTLEGYIKTLRLIEVSSREDGEDLSTNLALFRRMNLACIQEADINDLQLFPGEHFQALRSAIQAFADVEPATLRNMYIKANILSQFNTPEAIAEIEKFEQAAKKLEDLKPIGGVVADENLKSIKGEEAGEALTLLDILKQNASGEADRLVKQHKFFASRKIQAIREAIQTNDADQINASLAKRRFSFWDTMISKLSRKPKKETASVKNVKKNN